MNYSEIQSKLKELNFLETEKGFYTKIMPFGVINLHFQENFLKGEFLQKNSSVKDIVFFDWKEDITSGYGFSVWFLYYLNGGILDKTGTVGYHNYVENRKNLY